MKKIVAPLLICISTVAIVLFGGLSLAKADEPAPAAGRPEVKILFKCGTMKGTGTIYILDGDEVQEQQIVCGTRI